MADFGSDGRRKQRFRPAGFGFIDGGLAVDQFLIGSGTKQKTDFTPGTPEENDVFTITLNGEAISFTAPSTPTVADITDGLTTAIAASGQSGVLTATDNTTKVTVESDIPGLAFTFATSTVNGGAADTQTLVSAVVTANAANGIKAPVTGKLKEVSLQARIAPAGSDLKVFFQNITRGLSVEVSLTDGSTFVTDDGPNMAVAVNDLLSAVITQVGSGTAGSGLHITPYQEIDL